MMDSEERGGGDLREGETGRENRMGRWYKMPLTLWLQRCGRLILDSYWELELSEYVQTRF